MGTKVQIENYLPGHHSMRDLTRESNSASWPSCYGDNNLPSGQFYYGFLPRTAADSHPGYDKDVVKQTMLEHEAVFKNQVYELHRLYQVQRDLMDEVRRKEQFKHRIPYETSSSSSPVPSQMQSEDVQRWNGSSLPFGNSVCGTPPFSGPDAVQFSPYSAKGKSIRAGPSPFENCCSPKNSEVSESRPTKFRRRMLDLQLPADEYIDTDEVEQLGGAKVSDNTSPSPDKNRNFSSINGKLSVNYCGKTECHGDASRTDSLVGKSKSLADLNEPLQVEETNAVSSVDFLGSSGRSEKVLSSSQDVALNSRCGTMNGTYTGLYSENRTNGQDWFSCALESEHHKGGLRTVNQGILPEKAHVPSQPVQILLDRACQPPGFPLKEKSAGDVEKSGRSYYSRCIYNMPEPVPPPHVPNQPSVFHPTELGKSSDQLASSWAKPSCWFSQKSDSVQTIPYFASAATLTKSPQSSAQTNDLFETKWNPNSTPGLNAAHGCEPPVRNGFHQGPSASVKELAVCFDPVNCTYSDKRVPCSNNYFKAGNCTDANIVKDINLNVAVEIPNGVSNVHISRQGGKIIDKDHISKDPPAVLPWLRRMGSCGSNEAEISRKGQNSLESVIFQGPSVVSSLCNGDVKTKKLEGGDFPSSRKILGVPIFEDPPVPKNEQSAAVRSSTHHRSGNDGIGGGGIKRGFDINVPCEPTDFEMGVEVVVIEKKAQTEGAGLRNHFDLNSCITEDEIPCGTALPENSAGVKVGTGIDLEAPVVLESEEVVFPDEDSSVKEPEKEMEVPPDRADDGEAELAKSAAEAIIAISSSLNGNQPEEELTRLPLEGGSDDPLRWFVDIAYSSGNDIENQLVPDKRDKGQRAKGDCLPEGLDDFETMTLRLKECDPEDYFPKPSVPEIPNLEQNGGHVFATRTRKGHARRGRQRRDFQRDILPGLTSLSRHEVTEDLQTFGGLMRATGHPWQSGPNRRAGTRNGCGRGRQRSMVAVSAPADTVCALLKEHQQQQHQQQRSNYTEAGLEDKSLTGWGKTTRRPRRQRFPAGNPPPPVTSI